jgi:hypothetical protein
MKIGNRKWVDWAGDRECGTEDRAEAVAASLGISNFNSQNDARQANDECRRQNNANNSSSPEPEPEPEPFVDSGPTFVGSNADGEGLTQAEYDLYADQTMASIYGAQSQQLQDSVNSTSLAIQNLENEANALSEASATGRTVYSEDAASWRTQYSIDAQERWNNFGKAMDYKTATDSEKIRGEYSLDLRKIMNAGNESVAKITGEYSTANTKIQGMYNLAGEKVRGDAARDVAKTNKDASIFGNFVGGFWS